MLYKLSQQKAARGDRTPWKYFMYWATFRKACRSVLTLPISGSGFLCIGNALGKAIDHATIFSTHVVCKVESDIVPARFVHV